MRIIVVGAGAVGGVVAANLSLAGTPVVAVARGEHARVMRASGLRYESPSGTRIVELPVATSVGEIGFADSDVIMLAVKSHDTAAVLHELRAAGATDQPIVCMQNGVDNERQALRLFPNVYGMVVMLPADHLSPCVVRVWTAPSSGLLDIGRYPHGADDLCVRLATTLEAATFGSIPRDDLTSEPALLVPDDDGVVTGTWLVYCGFPAPMRVDAVVRAGGRTYPWRWESTDERLASEVDADRHSKRFRLDLCNEPHCRGDPCQIEEL